MTTTPQKRVLMARLAAHERWSRTPDRAAATAAARANGPASLERQVDPGGALPEATRRILAVNARKAHFTRLSLASARARAAKTR